MKESEFQKSLKDEIRKRFPCCVILKNDANGIQGFPDLTLLFGRLWAVLEVKKDSRAAHRPNQDYYIQKLKDSGGFASFVYPENKEEVLDALERWFSDA